MDILFLSDNFPPESNAPANRTYEHAKTWVAQGHKVTVITCVPNFPNGKVYKGYKNKWYQVEDMSGIRVVRVRTYMTANERFTRRVFDFLSFMITGSIAALFQPKPDVVIATSPQFFCGVAGMIVSTLIRKPFVLEVRDLWPESIVALGAVPNRLGVKMLRAIEGTMYRRAKLIIIVSGAFRTAIAARLDNDEKIRVVVNGVDRKLFNPSPILKPSRHYQHEFGSSFVVCYIGTHGRAHALAKTLDAAKILQSYKEIKFLYIGSGEKRTELEALVESGKLHNVTLLPQQPRDSIPGFMSLGDVALVPLRDIPLFSTVIPSKIFENMGMGLPMIASIPPGEATSIVSDTRSGVIVEPENSEQLASAILMLYKNRALLKKLANNAETAAHLYERTMQATKMLSYLQDLLPAHASRSQDISPRITDIERNSRSE